MEDNRNTQSEFIVNKLLSVIESTTENLVKLKSELSSSRVDHTRQNEMLDALINKYKDLENTLNNFKERKPFEIFERIEDKQDNNSNTLKVISDKVCDNHMIEDVTEIKTNVDYMRNKEDGMRRWVIILSAISTIAIIFMAMFKVFFEDVKMTKEDLIKEVIKELNIDKL